MRISVDEIRKGGRFKQTRVGLIRRLRKTGGRQATVWFKFDVKHDVRLA